MSNWIDALIGKTIEEAEKIVSKKGYVFASLPEGTPIDYKEIDPQKVYLIVRHNKKNIVIERISSLKVVDEI